MAIVIRTSIGLDHPSVQSVIGIAEEILSENKILNTELLYNIAKRRLKLPRKGLLSIIQFLLDKRILVEGSRFTKETVLSSPYRNGIYNFIKTHLGSHFSIIRKKAFPEIKGKTESAGQLIWHLEMLIKFNYIKKVKFKKYTLFIPIELDDKLGIYLFLLRDNINKKIVNLLIKQDKTKKSDIYKQLNEKRENVYYRIDDLMNHNIISLIEEDHNKICVNPKNKDIIVKLLNKLQT